RRANRLAHLLRDRGAGPERFVAVALPRGVDMVAVLLAVLKSNAAYIPVDPEFPTDRIRHMLADAGPALLVTTGTLVEAGAIPVLAVEPAYRGSAGHPDTDPELSATPDSPAYAIYTSGSTGRPKAVVVTRGALLNFLLSMRELFPMHAGDRLMAVTTIA